MNKDIENYLTAMKIVYSKPKFLEKKVAKLLSEQKIIGWFSGAMEFGPRALGNRSILADPRDNKMQKTLNLKTKFRESFRPFAPIVLEEEASNWFKIKQKSEYMLIVSQITNCTKLNKNDDKKNEIGLKKLGSINSKIPAVTHIDGSARVQTISCDNNPRIYRLLKSFYKLTNCPVLVNTSFNVRGEPIVCSPEDAYLCFMRTNIDYLVLNEFLVAKSDQENWENDDWKNEYVLD